MPTIRNLFENSIMKEEVFVVQKRKKIGDKFYNLYFIKKKDGSFIGRPMGYDTKEGAVRDLLSIKDPSFMKKNTVLQKKSIDRYIETHKL